ncbi:hypothetical protein GCM10028820_22520 [Tessaracoccus terricola]
MSAPGWYPDPSGEPNRVRYWDGTAWSGAPHQRRRSGGWTVGIGALVVVAALVIAFLVWPGGSPVAEDTRTARPSGTVWDELPGSETPSPSPTPTPSPAESGGEAVECPRVENERSSETRGDGVVQGGNLTFPVPYPWEHPYGRISRVLTDQDSTIKRFPGSTWMSLLVAGVAPTSAGFTDARTTANQIIECHITSGNVSGLTGSEIEVNEAFVVDGVEGWRVRAHAYTPNAPGGGAVFEVVVLDTGHELGLSVFWGGVVDADDEALETMTGMLEQIRIVR